MHSEGPGAHEWSVWDRDILMMMKLFDIKKEGAADIF